MPVDVDGVKYACAGCIAGHRATSCPHWDRWMLRVRQPGRPLTTCPHAGNDCPCARTKVMMMKIFVNGKCFCAPDPNARPKDEDKPKKKKTPRAKTRGSISSSRAPSESAGPSPKSEPDATPSDVVHASIETALRSAEAPTATGAAHQGFGSCCSSKKSGVSPVVANPSVLSKKQITPITTIGNSVPIKPMPNPLNIDNYASSVQRDPSSAKRRRLSETTMMPQMVHGCGTPANHAHTAITQPISLNTASTNSLGQTFQPPTQFAQTEFSQTYMPGVFNYIQPGMHVYNTYVMNTGSTPVHFNPQQYTQQYAFPHQQNSNPAYAGMPPQFGDNSNIHLNSTQILQPQQPVLGQQAQSLIQPMSSNFTPGAHVIPQSDSWHDAYMANPLLNGKQADFDQHLGSPLVKDEFSGFDSTNVSISCNCGDLCACVACPVHPFNSTTTTMARDLYNIMEADFAAEEAANTLPTPDENVDALTSPFGTFAPNVLDSPFADTRPSTSNGLSEFPLPIPDYGNYQFVFQWCQGNNGDICGCPEGDCNCPGCLTHGNPPASEELGDPTVPSKTVTMDGPGTEEVPRIVPQASSVAPSPTKKSCCGG